MIQTAKCNQKKLFVAFFTNTPYNYIQVKLLKLHKLTKTYTIEKHYFKPAKEVLDPTSSFCIGKHTS